MDISQLFATVSYCPETGGFVWTNPGCRVGLEGKRAGSVAVDGYVILSIQGMRCRAHRAAWCFAHGAWPDGQIDHINGLRGDNRIANLRCVTPAENRQNQRVARSDSSTGLLGVTPCGKRFRAVVHVDGRALYFGRFDTPLEAHLAALAAKRELHAAFAG